jgi:prepilin-type N-terminal cleavage/methylation domain-containing protein
MILRSKRSGLTLVELIIVLVILAALAGVVVPLFPSMQERTHTASGASNLSEVGKLVQTYDQLYQTQPTDFDALLSSSGAIPDYLPQNASGQPLGGQITAGPLSPAQRTALVNAGIVRLQTLHGTRAALDTAGGSTTFNPYDGGIVTLTTGTPSVAFLAEAMVEGNAGVVSDPGGINGDSYVLFGFGKRCSMVGKVTMDAPVHFGESPAENAANVYSRVGLVYRVTRGGTVTTNLSRAEFVGAVDLHGDGIIGIGSHLEEYYQLTK